MPKCIILRGIPCSGKSTWLKSYWINVEYYGCFWKVHSCDAIRIEMANGKYIYSKKNEERVWADFYLRIELSVQNKESFVIDNTNMQQKYINNILCRLTDDYEFEIKTFYVPLWKAHLRNIIRRIKTGKWIPIKVMNNFHKRYKQLKQNG